MSSEWTDEGIYVGGSTFGDEQVGDDHQHRYVRQLPDRTYLVADHVFAAAMREEQEDDEGLRYYAAEATWITYCTDPKDPGNTEISGEIEYGDGSLFAYASQAEAEQEARRLAAVDIRFALDV